MRERIALIKTIREYEAKAGLSQSDFDNLAFQTNEQLHGRLDYVLELYGAQLKKAT